MKTPKVRTILKSKKDPKVTDPPRFPSIINPIENEVKRDFANILNTIVMDTTKEMVKQIKTTYE